ncbi:MAG: dipeptide epimerase [Chitinophagales bacterium]
MRITDLSLERYDLQLTEPYTIAYETISTSTNFILRLKTDNAAIEGFGCAAPDIPVTHESPKDIEDIFENVLVPSLKGADSFHFTQIVHQLKESKLLKSSALNMVDMALFDVVSKIAGVPLYRYLGAFRKRIPTSVTIGILPLKETLQKAEEFVEQGFYILKIKGGLDVEEDIGKLTAIKKKYPSIILRFDGNQGYTLEETIYFASKVETLNVEIIEQPMTTSEEENYTTLSATISQAVMADESLKTLNDTFLLAKNSRVNMINIKLMKVGGLQEGFHINSVAKSAGYDVMVGCLDECQLGISAGLHFALSRPNIEYADLDSFLDFKNDPYPNLFHLKNGVLYPSEKAGLGI